jgi:hypothetical protein
MGALVQDGLADGTVGRNITLTFDRKYFVGEVAEKGVQWKSSVKKRLSVWFEAFTCAVGQWYLEFDCYCLCVKIHYQKTESENISEE